MDEMIAALAAEASRAAKLEYALGRCVVVMGDLRRDLRYLYMAGRVPAETYVELNHVLVLARACLPAAISCTTGVSGWRRKSSDAGGPTTGELE